MTLFVPVYNLSKYRISMHSMDSSISNMGNLISKHERCTFGQHIIPFALVVQCSVLCYYVRCSVLDDKP